MGPVEDQSATTRLADLGMTIRAFDAHTFRPAAERLWESEANALDVASWLRTIRA